MPEKLRRLGNSYLFLGLLLISCSTPTATPNPTKLPTRSPETPTLTSTLVVPTATTSLTIPISPTPKPTITETPKLTAVIDKTSPLLSTLRTKAKENRHNRTISDPEYNDRIDQDLAKRAVLTVEMFGCGWDHEPPALEKVYICSNSLFVLTNDGKMHVINFTHDTRAPEAERAAGILGKPNSAMRLEQAWMASNATTKKKVGGIPLVRETFEDATGFPVDYVIQFEDKVITDFVDQIFDGKIFIDIPDGFISLPIYTNETIKIPERAFPKGPQTLTSIELLQYIKGVVKTESTYPAQLENNIRKSIAIEAIKNQLMSKAIDPRFTLGGGISKLTDFLEKEKKNGAVVTDLPTFELLGSAPDIMTAITQHGIANLFPEKGENIYFADPTVTGITDMPMIWGIAERNDHFVIQDLTDKVYVPGFVEVPKNCDAKSSQLYKNCWQDVRKYIRQKISP